MIKLASSLQRNRAATAISSGLPMRLIRYVGDHVQAFANIDCVLVGSHLPHCWTEQGCTTGFALQFNLPPDLVLDHLGGGHEVRRLAGARAGRPWLRVCGPIV